MKLIKGKPRWKSKPKASPLDTDVEYVKLKATIMSGKMKPFEDLSLLFNQDDCDRLGSKNPWRMVRDHLRRLVKSLGWEADYAITCRQTDDGSWAVSVTYEPPNLAATKKDRKISPYINQDSAVV